MIRLTRYYHPSRNKKFPPFSPIHYASTKTLPVSLSVSATTISTVTTSNDTTTTATDFPNKNDGPSVYHYRCYSSSRPSSCRPILMSMPMPMSKSTTPNLNSNYLNHPNYAMPTLAFHSPPSYSFSTSTTITTNTTTSSTNTSSSSNSNASSKRRKKRKRHRASSKPSSPHHHHQQHSHDKTPNETATHSHSHSNAHHTTSTSHKRVSRRRRKGIGSFPRPSSSSPSSFPKSPSSSSSSLFPNHNHNSNSWGKSKSKQRKEDYDYNPIRLHKMERRLTYLLTQYYSTLDISLPASAYALDSESNSDSESKFDSNSDSDLDHSHMSTTTNKTLPFYSSISTPQLASILLHPSLSSSSSSSSSSSRVVVDYDKLLETETLYQQIQLTIRQIIIGWIKCNANSNGLSPSSPSSWLSSRPHSRPRSRPFHGKSPYEQSLLLPPLKSQNQIQTQTTHSSFQTNDNNNNNDHDVRAIHILRAQYPIRAEVWLDKMEELRWQRHQMVQHYVDLDTENKKGFWNQLTHKMAGMFSTTNHNDNDYNGGDMDPKKCQAHLTFAPTTSIYIQLLQAHRKSYFHKVHAQGGYGNETTLSSESSSSLSDASTSPLYKDNNNNNNKDKDKDNLLSFLSSHAITKRQENVLQKALVSQQRHNPHVNPNDYGMLLYKELLKQYAHNGTKAKDADRLCQQILAYRQQQQQQQQQQNEKDREEDMDNDDNDGSDNEEQDDRNNNNDDNTEDTSYSQIQSVFKRVNKDAYLIRLVMKAYARDCSSHPEHALRMEELLEDLKQLENSHTNRTSYTKLPPGSIANPEAYNLCFRAYQSAGWKAIPDMATRTQRLFHEISTTLWDNQSQSHRHNTNTTMYNHKKHKSLYGRHLERDLVEMYNRVMAIYTASRDVNYLHKAKSILQYMEKTYLEDNHKFQIPPNTRSFNTLLKGFINQRQQTRNNKIVAKLGTNMMKRMIYLPDAKPNEETYALLLQLWLLDSNGGSAEIGMQSEMIFSQLESDAMKLLSRHNHHHHYYNNTHMSGSGSGNGNAGTGNNHSIQWNGEGNPPNVDIKMYTRLIRNWRQSAAQNVPYAAQRAYDLLCRMEVESGRNIGGIDPRWGTSPFWDLGLTPDAKTYENVIAVCASTATTNPKDQDHALDIAFNTYHKMIQYGMKPDVVGILRCISQLVSPAQSRKRSMLAKKALEPVMMMMENDQEHHYHHGLINNAAKGALRKCSQEVYDDYYGDNNDDDDVDSLGEKNPELT